MNVSIINKKTHIVFGASAPEIEREDAETKDINDLSEEDLREGYVASNICVKDLVELIEDLTEKNVKLQQEKEEREQKIKSELERRKEAHTELEQEFSVLEKENSMLKERLAGETNQRWEEGVMTVPQKAIFFYYLFRAGSGLFQFGQDTVGATDPRITGNSKKRIRNELYFDFESKNIEKHPGGFELLF